jgi:hypothetical protein
MKNLFFCISLFISVSVNSQKIKSVHINSIPLLTTTDIRIPCSNFFYENFKKQLLQKVITSDIMLSQIQKLILKFKVQNGNSIDVRGQIIIYYSNHDCKRICFNSSGEFYENGKIFTNAELFTFLKTQNFIRDF